MTVDELRKAIVDLPGDLEVIIHATDTTDYIHNCTVTKSASWAELVDDTYGPSILVITDGSY